MDHFCKRALVGRAHRAQLFIFVTIVALAVAGALAAGAGNPPSVGEKAADFTLSGITGGSVTLSAELAHGPVVLVLLRGFPGYQCPFCTKQYGDFLRHATDFDAMGVRVVFVYPGPSEQLQQHAEEFLAGAELPSNFRFLLDPAYAFTEAYGLRWNAPSETSYPSTFVIDRTSIVRFAHISHAHDGRAQAADVLKALARINR